MLKSITRRPDPPRLVLVLSVQLHLWTNEAVVVGLHVTAFKDRLYDGQRERIISDGEVK